MVLAVLPIVELVEVAEGVLEPSDHLGTHPDHFFSKFVHAAFLFLFNYSPAKEFLFPFCPKMFLSYVPNQCFGSGSARIFIIWPYPRSGTRIHIVVQENLKSTIFTFWNIKHNSK